MKFDFFYDIWLENNISETLGYFLDIYGFDIILTLLVAS